MAVTHKLVCTPRSATRPKRVFECMVQLIEVGDGDRETMLREDTIDAHSQERLDQIVAVRKAEFRAWLIERNAPPAAPDWTDGERIEESA